MDPSWGDSDEEFPRDREPASVEAPSRTRVVLWYLGLAIIGSAAAIGWHDRELIISQSAPEIAVAPAINPDVSSALKNLQAFQLQTAGQINQITQNIAATQADLKKLSDQLSALTARLDALQNAAAVPSPSPTAHPSAAPAHAQLKPGEKPIRAPKPAGTAGVPMKLGPN
jgi:uncharacterized coiled-coil protein SlyX